MKKRLTCIVFLLIIILALPLLGGCTTKPNNEISDMSQTAQSPELPIHEGNWYDKFNLKGYNSYSDLEDLAQYREIDIVSIVEKHSSAYGSDDSVWDILTMNYSVIPCNFSKSDINYNDDAFVVIDINKTKWQQNCVIYCAFVRDEDDKYVSVYDVRYHAPSYRLLDLTGDFIQELIITHDDGGNGYTEEYLDILQINNTTANMIFSQLMFFNGQPYSSFDVHWESEYEFVPYAKKGYDILVKTKVLRSETQLIEHGSSLYKYDGTKYSANNYYDCKAAAQKVCDSAQSAHDEAAR